MTIHAAAVIHQAAVVHVENVIIGANTKVWQFASVIRGARVGSDCTIASCALIDGAKVGDRVIIGHAAAIEPGVSLGNDVFVGPHVSFCNDAWPRVSKDNFDMVPLLRGEIVVTVIEDGASLGAGVVVLPGYTVGAGAMIAAGAVVDRNVPAFHLLKRDGTLTLIDPKRTLRRVRAAGGSVSVAAE